MFGKKNKEETLIDQEIKRRNENDQAAKLKERADKLRSLRERAEEREKLRKQIRDDEQVVRREKYRHVYSFGQKLQGSGRKLGELGDKTRKSSGFARRASNNMNSQSFQNFLGFGKPARAKPRRSKRRTIIIYQ